MAGATTSGGGVVVALAFLTELDAITWALECGPTIGYQPMSSLHGARPLLDSSWESADCRLHFP